MTLLSTAKRVRRHPKGRLEQPAEVSDITKAPRKRDLGDRPATAAISQFSTALRQTPRPAPTAYRKLPFAENPVQVAHRNAEVLRNHGRCQRWVVEPAVDIAHDTRQQ